MDARSQAFRHNSTQRIDTESNPPKTRLFFYAIFFPPKDSLADFYCTKYIFSIHVISALTFHYLAHMKDNKTK